MKRVESERGAYRMVKSDKIKQDHWHCIGIGRGGGVITAPAIAPAKSRFLSIQLVIVFRPIYTTSFIVYLMLEGLPSAARFFASACCARFSPPSPSDSLLSPLASPSSSGPFASA